MIFMIVNTERTNSYNGREKEREAKDAPKIDDISKL